MTRWARIGAGALLIALFLAWLYLREYSSLAEYLPKDAPIRFIAHLIAWGSLLGGVSLIGSAWVPQREVKHDER